MHTTEKVNGISKRRLREVLSEIKDLVRRAKACSVWFDAIEEFTEKEDIKVALDAMEEILPGTKEGLLDAKDPRTVRIKEKCIAFGLL